MKYTSSNIGWRVAAVSGSTFCVASVSYDAYMKDWYLIMLYDGGEANRRRKILENVYRNGAVDTINERIYETGTTAPRTKI